jgi:hypothetical protein
MSWAPRGSQVAVLVAFVLVSAGPSLGVAQTTLNLGQAAQYSLFEVQGSAGKMKLTNTSVLGDVGLGSGTAYAATNSPITGTVTRLAPRAQANADAIDASSQAAGLSRTGAIKGNAVSKTMTFTGNAGQNVVNLFSINLTNATFTISGSASSIFVFNVAGAITLTNSIIQLVNGVSADHVFFNVTGSNKAVTLKDSQVSGTFLDLKGSISVSGGSSQGAFISQKAISIANHILTGNPPMVAAAPEMPTILMAGLACLLLLGKTGLDRWKHPRATMASPQL